MVTENKTEEKSETKVFERYCPHCNKSFSSLSEKQLLFNYTSHIGSCKFKKDKEDKK